MTQVSSGCVILPNWSSARWHGNTLMMTFSGNFSNKFFQDSLPKQKNCKNPSPQKKEQKTVERVFAFEFLVKVWQPAVNPPFIQLNQEKPLEVEDLKPWGSSAIPTSEVNHNKVVISKVQLLKMMQIVFRWCFSVAKKTIQVFELPAEKIENYTCWCNFCLKLKEIYDYRIRHLDKNNWSAYPARQFQKTPIRNKCFFWNP